MKSSPLQRHMRINGPRGFCGEFGIAIQTNDRAGLGAISRLLAYPHTAVRN
jgi:hypothetical protein